jgi:hypothetical protein
MCVVVDDQADVYDPVSNQALMQVGLGLFTCAREGKDCFFCTFKSINDQEQQVPLAILCLLLLLLLLLLCLVVMPPCVTHQRNASALGAA